jgi:hypothetical protein
MNTLNISLKEYLQNSLKADNKDLCRGWKYLKENITAELKAVIEKQEYQAIEYNSQNEAFILKEIKEDLTAEEKKQLGSFVYVQKDLKREQAKKDKEAEILSRGYIKIYGTQKELNDRKVKGIFNISKIGMMGSFNSLEEQEGTLKYAECYQSLMLIPKGNRTRGFIIRDFAYIKSEVQA